MFLKDVASNRFCLKNHDINLDCSGLLTVSTLLFQDLNSKIEFINLMYQDRHGELKGIKWLLCSGRKKV